MLEPTLGALMPIYIYDVNDYVQLCSRSFNIARNSYSTLFHETLSEIQNVAFIEDITNKRKIKANTRYFM